MPAPDRRLAFPGNGAARTGRAGRGDSVCKGCRRWRESAHQHQWWTANRAMRRCPGARAGSCEAHYPWLEVLFRRFARDDGVLCLMVFLVFFVFLNGN